MRKNKNTKSRVVDLLIILLCFAGTGVSGFAFWREYNRTLVKLNEKPVGSIVFKNRTAHRKIENRIAWDRLKQESPVYNGDTIRTAEASEAFITFEDSVTRVNLYENTLIQVFYDGRETRIDFSGGNLDVSSGGRSVFISSGVSTVEVAGGGRASLNRGGGALSLSVIEGQARLDDGTELESGALLALLNDGAVDPNPAVAVTSFGPFARILAPAGGTASAVFVWNTVNFTPDTHVAVEVSRDREFSRIAQGRDVWEASSIAVPLEIGEYWWRVYPVQGASRAVTARGAVSGRIEVLSSAAISAIAPVQMQEFTFSGETRVPFSWTAVEGAGEYALEISGNPDMSDPAVSRRVQGTSVVQAGLEPGRWYWRVSPVFSRELQGTAQASETAAFVVIRNDTPGVPVLVAPAQNEVVDMDRLRLSWKYDSGAASWVVEVADNPQMSRPLLRQEVVSNFYSLSAGTLRNEQDYFWRVTAQGFRDTASSPVRSFTAGGPVYRSQAIFPPDNYSVAAEEFAGLYFSYRSNAPSQNYFQVSSRDDFSSLAVNEAADAESFYPASGLEPGIWYWRMYAEDVSAGTVPRRLNVVSASETPRVRTPAAEVSRGAALELGWDSLYFASYEVNVYGADDASPIARQITESNSAVFPTSSLEPGDYIVSVAGFNPESPRSGRIAGTPADLRFTVTPAPEAVMIPVAAVIPPPPPVEPPPPPPVAVVPEPPPLVVVPEPEPVAAVVPEPEPEPVVAAPEPAPVAAVIPEPEPEPVVVVPEPAPVVAVVPEPAAPPFNLARPIPGSFPPDDYVLTTGQLAGVSSVNFVWEGNAPQYRFTLYRADGTIVVPSFAVDSPSFTMQNPRSLEPGDYVWEVVERDRQGRFGESAAARFSVREGPAVLVPVPTKDPGVLYGNR